MVSTQAVSGSRQRNSRTELKAYIENQIGALLALDHAWEITRDAEGYALPAFQGENYPSLEMSVKAAKAVESALAFLDIEKVSIEQVGDSQFVGRAVIRPRLPGGSDVQIEVSKTTRSRAEKALKSAVGKWY